MAKREEVMGVLQATLPKASFLKKLLDAVKDLVTDANFDCSEEGITLQAMDSSHVALVSLSLTADLFENDFACPKHLLLGVKMESMSKILKCAANDDSVTLRNSEENPDVLIFTFEGKNKTSDFELKLLDIQSEPLTIPTMDYSVTVSMPSAEFQKICKDLSVLGDTVIISATKDGIKFSTSGDIAKGNVLVKSSLDMDEGKDRTTIRLEEPVEMTFALRYLNLFSKATGLSETVNLNMSKEVPLVIEYSIDGGRGYLRYYLAPKIED